MECKTIKSYTKLGNPRFTNKVKHATFADAQREADRFNSLPGIYIRREAYQCSVCGTYHVGTSMEMLANKEKPEVVRYAGKRVLKVVGMADEDVLDRIEYSNSKKNKKNQIKKKIPKQEREVIKERSNNVIFWIVVSIIILGEVARLIIKL